MKELTGTLTAGAQPVHSTCAVHTLAHFWCDASMIAHVLRIGLCISGRPGGRFRVLSFRPGVGGIDTQAYGCWRQRGHRGGTACGRCCAAHAQGRPLGEASTAGALTGLRGG